MFNYISDNDLVNNIWNQAIQDMWDLDKINLALNDIKYDIGVQLILDENWNMQTTISDDIIANYLARKLSLKNQIKSVSLEQNDGINKRIVVILNDNSTKTYQFKTNDFNYKDADLSDLEDAYNSLSKITWI